MDDALAHRGLSEVHRLAVVGGIANTGIIKIGIVNGWRINQLIIPGPQCF
jgi:hypothetical protein